MPNILLGVTGSVAAIRTSALFAALRAHRCQVKIVATKAATYFFDPSEIATNSASSVGDRDRELVILDEDEWPEQNLGKQFERGDQVLHIELRRWADLLLIAPLDANTLAKIVNGICDNCLTCVWRAWDTSRPVVLAPAMNTFMWQNPITLRHLKLLAWDAGTVNMPERMDELMTIETINRGSTRLRIVPPVVKQLACGDVGVGAMAEVETIVAVVLEETMHINN